MKAKYIGRTTIENNLENLDVPHLIYGKFYEIIKQNDSNYMIYDEDGKYRIVNKYYFERGDSM